MRMTEEKNDVKYNDGMIVKPAEFESPDKLYEDLISCVRKYHPSDNVTQIEMAYGVAKQAHEGQIRRTVYYPPVECCHHPGGIGNG